MTMTDRKPFEPAGPKSLRELVHDGIATLVPLEPNMRVTYDMIGEWLGRPFPLPSFGTNGWTIPNFAPMNQVIEDLLVDKGVLLLNVTNEGYRVATDSEKLAWLDDRWRKSGQILKSIGRVAASVNPQRVDSAGAQLAKEFEVDAREAGRVLRQQARARARARRQWGGDPADE